MYTVDQIGVVLLLTPIKARRLFLTGGFLHNMIVGADFVDVFLLRELQELRILWTRHKIM